MVRGVSAPYNIAYAEEWTRRRARRGSGEFAPLAPHLSSVRDAPGRAGTRMRRSSFRFVRRGRAARLLQRHVWNVARARLVGRAHRAKSRRAARALDR